MALTSFTIVGSPETAFAYASARVVEIIVAIICAAVCGFHKVADSYRGEFRSIFVSADLALCPRGLSEDMMPRRKQARHTDVKDIRSILRLTFEQGLSIRAVSERLKMSKTSVSTYLLRAKEAGLASGRYLRAWMRTTFSSIDYSGEWAGLHAIPSSRTGRRWPAN